MCSWDDVIFVDMIHNQKDSSAHTREVDKHNEAFVAPTVAFPATDPYYFSQGTISLFGVTHARIRNFSLTINNNLDPKYYIRDAGTGRIPAEIHEGRREYSMSASIALPDSLITTSTTRTLFKELLAEGVYNSTIVGFDVSLVFTRGTNDTITITIPPSTAAVGGDAQGAFIRSATTSVTDANPVEAEVDILFRAMQIVTVDAVSTYP